MNATHMRVGSVSPHCIHNLAEEVRGQRLRQQASLLVQEIEHVDPFHQLPLHGHHTLLVLTVKILIFSPCVRGRCTADVISATAHHDDDLPEFHEHIQQLHDVRVPRLASIPDLHMMCVHGVATGMLGQTMAMRIGRTRQPSRCYMIGVLSVRVRSVKSRCFHTSRCTATTLASRSLAALLL